MTEMEAGPLIESERLLPRGRSSARALPDRGNSRDAIEQAVPPVLEDVGMASVAVLAAGRLSLAARVVKRGKTGTSTGLPPSATSLVGWDPPGSPSARRARALRWICRRWERPHAWAPPITHDAPVVPCYQLRR